jgi:hypothetical protein
MTLPCRDVGTVKLVGRERRPVGGTARLSVEHSSTAAPLPGTVHKQPIFARLVRL